MRSQGLFMKYLTVIFMLILPSACYVQNADFLPQPGVLGVCFFY